MSLTQSAEDYIKRAFKNKNLADEGKNAFASLARTDPEFYEFFANFAFDEVKNSVPVDDKTAHICVLAVLLGCKGADAFRMMLPAALNFGVSAQEIREIVYQGTAYLGIGRVMPFIHIMNKVFLSRGIELPLENASTAARNSRLKSGNEAQIEIFGEGMREFWKNAPEGRERVNYWLADNCFGDYYTRGVLDFKQRELITFCFLYAQGGCEPQLVSHAQGNMRVGNDKALLYNIVSLCIPYVGYPRSLNALSSIDAAEKNMR